MDKNFFKKIRILDGGMGQQLLAKGLISKGTLWSASANLDKNFHDLVVDVPKPHGRILGHGHENAL